MKKISLIIILAALLLASCGTANLGSSGGLETMTRDSTTTSTVNVRGRVDNYPDLAAYIRGRVSGVQVSPDGRSVAIRGGVPTANSTGSPLIIVDGSEMSFSTANEMVAPADIQSVTVDKEGTLYGFRGVNGVIIIKTKKGSE